MGIGYSKHIEKKKGDIKNEVIISPEGLHSLDESIARAAKSICKIIVPPNEKSSGFLIQLFKDEKELYCLMTNEHVITKKMIEQKIKIDLYYDAQSKFRKIKLNPEERLIKDFRDIQMDVTVIEILSKDDISKDYFLLPLIDYMDNYNQLINKEISIIQYPNGEMKYSYGKIKYLTYEPKYEFAHNADTDKGSSGSPIFLKGTTKVVGIHKGGIETKNMKENFGDFIWPIFTYFKNYSENTIKNKKLGNNSISDKLNSMTIIYEIKYDCIKLFGEEFVKDNINNCYLLIDNDEVELCEYLYLNEEQKKKNELKIKLIEKDKITSMNYLFSRCDLLKELPDISNWDTKNIITMNKMFFKCYSLNHLPDISKLNTKNVKYMISLFESCESLKRLPDISKWDTKNVTNMSYMFYGCESLIELPDISSWNTENVSDMSGMFTKCKSLK